MIRILKSGKELPWKMTIWKNEVGMPRKNFDRS